MSEANKAVVQRVVDEIINQGKLDLADELFSPNYRSHRDLTKDASPSAAGADGPDSIKQGVGGVRTAFPDVHCVTDLMVAEDDKVVARITLTGTHTGTFLGTAPTGKRFNRTGMHMLRLEDGKIVEQWVQSDDLSMLQQLGIVPPLK